MRTHLDIKHEGTVGDDDRTRMTFDENSLAFLQGVLTDLYSDKEMAVIREISTNARDSHVAAGVDKPIEVELPNGLVRTLIIRDFGVGLSEQEVHENFSKYGWSSKRDSDEAVGMLGLGCKSPLSYTSQFTMVATKDGKRVTVLITRDSDGCGVVQTVHREDCDEPNGVEVQVPVDSYDQFRQKATEFFRFWEPGTVLVDGVAPVVLGEQEGELVLDPDVIISPYISRDYIIMGNVPYPIDHYKHGRLIPWSSRGGHHQSWAAVRVPIGCVNFTPSREELQYTKRTENTIFEARQFITHTVERMARLDVESAADHQEALAKAAEWRKAKFDVTLSYKGDSVPDNWLTVSYEHTRGLPSYGFLNNQAGKINKIEVRHLDKSTFIIGWRGNTVTKNFKKKLALFMEYCGQSSASGYGFIYLCRRDEVSPWVSKDQFLDYAMINEIELPVEEKEVRVVDVYLLLNENGAEYKPVPRPIYKMDARGSKAIDPKTGGYIIDSYMPPPKPTCYIFAGEAINRDNVVRALKDDTVAVVYKAKAKKFREMFPGVPHIEDIIFERTTAYADSLDDLTIHLLAQDTERRHSYMEVNATGVLEEVAQRLNGTLQAVQDVPVRALLGRLKKCHYGMISARWASLTFVCRHYAQKMHDDLVNSEPIREHYGVRILRERRTDAVLGARGTTQRKSVVPPFGEWYDEPRLRRPSKELRAQIDGIVKKYPLLPALESSGRIPTGEFVKYMNDQHMLAEGLHLSRAY